jgi:16S rRNA (guanine1207-N2)-methyltransferase
MTTDHYFSSRPRVKSRPARVHLELPDVKLELLTDRGVFAYSQLDRGTEILLRTVPPPLASSDLLDLGCGYGAVSITLAKRCPNCRIWAIDINERALALCEENARSAGADNVHVMLPDEMPVAVNFGAIYSNPPIRVGKGRLHELLATWLDRLLPGGHAYLVAQRNLGADSLAAWLRQRGHAVQRLRSTSGYRVLDVHTRSGTPHHVAGDE